MAKYRSDKNNPPRSSRGMQARSREDEPSRQGEARGTEGSMRRQVGIMEDTREGRGSKSVPATRPQGHEASLARQALASPFSFMRRFSEEMDRLFEDFGFGRGWLSPSMGEMSPSGFLELGRAAWTPQVEVFRRGDELVIRCDLPGMRKEDVRVDVQNDQLVIQGQRSWENEDDREGMMRSERRYGSFYRVLPLPEGVRAEDTRASYKDGVLEISVPAPDEQPRGHRVQID